MTSGYQRQASKVCVSFFLSLIYNIKALKIESLLESRHW